MARILLLAMFMLLVGAVALAVKSCSDRPSPERVVTNSSGLVALRDGSTMMAEHGTVGRELVDWLAAGKAGQRRFELGGQEFVGRTAEPTAESLGRIPRLVAMLRANPDVDVIVIGHSDRTEDSAADMALSLARARMLVGRLEAAGIEADRLKVEARGAAEPLASDATAEGRRRNQRVSLVLVRPE